MAIRNFHFPMATYKTLATGIVGEVTEFWDKETRAKRPGEEPPRVYKDGSPLVAVECSRIIENYGRRSTEIFSVRMPESPGVMALVGTGGTVELIDVSVSGYVRDGGIVMSWTAEDIAEEVIDLD